MCASRGRLGNQLANGQHSWGTAVPLGQDRRLLIPWHGCCEAATCITLSNEALPGLSLLCVYGGVGSLTTGSPRGHAFLGGVGSMGLGCLWTPCFLGWTWMNVQSGHRKCGCVVLLGVCVPCTQRSGFLAAMRAVLLWDDATEKVVFGTFGADPMPGFSGRG